MQPGMKHPDNMKRKDHLEYIKYLKRTGKFDDAVNHWLTHCPRISKLAFKTAK